MSFKALPIVFINLSGEMMYILDQRLKAQNISNDKSIKVVNDIVSTMFNQQFVDELFKPQELYSKQALRSIFEKLVHSSIMRLNSTSMDKLYDLMTMVFKYQIYMCPRPEDILFVTLNHLDAIRSYTKDSPDVLKLVDNVYSLLLKNFGQFSAGGYQFLRYTLLSFFQDLQIRVSVFLKNGIQLPNGKFVLPVGGPVPHGFQVPGTIRRFAPDGKVVETIKFEVKEKYENSTPPGSLEVDGNRGTILGCNIYATESETEQKTTEYETLSSNQQNIESDTKDDSSAFDEIAFLARLMGQNTIKSQASEITLGIFEGGAEAASSSSGVAVLENHNRVVNINVPQSMEQNILHKILDDLTVEEKESDTSDILDLLDDASY